MEKNFEVGFSDEAINDLKKIDKVERQKILSKLGSLGDFRKNNNVKKLSGDLSMYYRLRVGKIRVVFEVDEKVKRIKIEYLGFWGSIYR